MSTRTPRLSASGQHTFSENENAFLPLIEGDVLKTLAILIIIPSAPINTGPYAQKWQDSQEELLFRHLCVVSNNENDGLHNSKVLT